MFGFFIGTVCLVLLFANLRRRHYYAAYGPFDDDDRGYGFGGCGRGYGGFGRFGFGRGFWHGGRGRRGGYRKFIARQMLTRLDTTPGQEKAIRSAVETLRNSLIDGRDELSSLRRDLAQAFGGDVLDEEALTAGLAKQEAFVNRARGELVSAIRNVHEALDGRQRRQVAEWIAGGFSGRSRARDDDDWL
jgi:hypothetical protein